MKQQHHPWQIKKVFKGANRDLESELLGGANTGEVYDKRNMRSTSMDGDLGVAKKIKGEVVVLPKSEPGDHECIAAFTCNGKKVEVFADPTGAEDSYIRIDGVTVLKHPDFPANTAYPFQFDVNDSCIGGEFYLSDNETPPMIFNCQDLVDSVGSDKYFADFEYESYILNLALDPHIPVFVENEFLGGTSGLDVGKYAYAIRYVTADGDRTNFSAPTPLIPVLESEGSESREYPYVDTRGAGPGTATGYGPKIRFRVNNVFNYDFIEIRRIGYTSGSLSSTPVSAIVGRVDIFDGEISVREFIDDPDAFEPEIISEEEEINTIGDIEAAKTLRYFNNRLYLMNIKYRSRDIDGEFEFDEFAPATEMLPVMRKLGKVGFNDPWNEAYLKHTMSGEKYGWGIIAWDGFGGASFVQSIPNFENKQMPNRRDNMNPLSALYSYLGFSDAATVDGDVPLDATYYGTHEVFDMVDAVEKEEICDFKNILDAGSKSVATVTEYCPETPPGGGGPVGGSDIGYEPYHPTNDDDIEFTGHNFKNVMEVDQGSSWADWNGEGYGPNYYSMGQMLKGVTDLPSWAKAFSIVRTKPAKRVVAQGIGFYHMDSAQGIGAKNIKDKKKFWFYSPDLAAGIADPQDILSGASNFKVQLVSPLGIFSEMYAGDRNLGNDKGIDMMSYARVLYENGSINVGDGVGNVGINGYVAYGKWRNTPNPGSIWGSGSANGNTNFRILSFNRQTSGLEGRGGYFILEIEEDAGGARGIYDNSSASGDVEFDEANIQQWHEPFYIVNIIDEGADASTGDGTPFEYTGNYIKLESTIGVSDGSSGQSFQLVDERWEDCIPALNGSSPGLSGLDRTVTIRGEDGTEEVWVNVTYKSAVDIAAIKADIAGSIGPYSGVYTHTNDSNKFFTVELSDTDYIPPSGALVVVKYDPGAPIQVFGGDACVGESIFAPIDLQYDDDNTETGLRFDLENGFPYHRFRLNPRHYIINKATGINRIQDDNQIRLNRMRQLACMFTSESRIHTGYYHNSDYPNQYFPAIDYVMRPYRWDIGDPMNNIFIDYFTDYVGEENNFGWGGFRFLPDSNVDYSQSNRSYLFTKKPAFGFNEETRFCTRVIWSLRRPVNVVDAPGVRTFPNTNIFDISDDQGEIKYAWDALTGKGSNLYAFTQSGWCLLMTDKRIITQKTGDELGVAGADAVAGVLDQIWLSKEIGMNSEMWRSRAEFNNVIYFANNRSVFKASNNQLDDLGRKKYHSALYPQFLKEVLPGYTDKVDGSYDIYHNEYVLHIRQDRVENGIDFVREDAFIFSEINQAWEGGYDYLFDKMYSLDNQFFGVKNGETYELGIGFILNGNPIQAELINVSAPGFRGNEFIRIRVNSDNKPTRIEFYENDGLALVAFIDGTAPNSLRDYDGYEQYIPRKTAGNRDRMQGRQIFYKIIHNLEEEFQVEEVGVQHKQLK